MAKPRNGPGVSQKWHAGTAVPTCSINRSLPAAFAQQLNKDFRRFFSRLLANRPGFFRSRIYYRGFLNPSDSMTSATDLAATCDKRLSNPRQQRPKEISAQPHARIETTIGADGPRDRPGARFRRGGDGASDRWLGQPHRSSPRGVMLALPGRHRTSPEYRRR